MEKLIASQIKPIIHQYSDFLSEFETLAVQANIIRIAAGYVSTESILYLNSYVEQLKLSNFELLIGMHYFDGITKPEYESLAKFDTYLHSNMVGGINVFTAFPFHGKMYLFRKNISDLAALLGSSNLSALESIRQFEVDLEVTTPGILAEINNLYDELKNKATMPFHNWNPTKFKESGDFLGGCTGVNKISDQEKNTIWNKASNLKFQIPLKTEPKSNLNAFFGKGRQNMKTGVIRPRPWYEVELIVPKYITSEPGYPIKVSESGRVINVFTDDGWTFKCKISGDYSKNLRSEDDLKTLGLWIKGRLENSGALKVGDPVNDKTLEKYGRSTIDLIGTSIPDVWLLDFGGKK